MVAHNRDWAAANEGRRRRGVTKSDNLEDFNTGNSSVPAPAYGELVGDVFLLGLLARVIPSIRSISKIEG